MAQGVSRDGERAAPPPPLVPIREEHTDVTAGTYPGTASGLPRGVR